MLSVLDFRSNNGDTDYPEAAAILPITDGEPASQLVYRRPTENMRYRSEVLRDVLREHVILSDLDTTRLYGGGTLTFNGVSPTYDGKFIITTDLIVLPFGTPGRGSVTPPFVGSTKASLSVGTPASNEAVFTSVKKQWEGTAFPAADAAEISIEIVAGSSLLVTTKGAAGNLNHIYVTIVAGTTTCQQVIDAVNASAPANTLVLASLGAGSTGTVAASLWGPAQWAGDYTKRFLKGGASGVLHSISSTALATFFAASVDNCIKEGDTIGIWYEKNIDKTSTGGRLQSTYENGNYQIPAGSLFNSRREPEKLPNSISLCKCLDSDTLLFADGTYIVRGVGGSLGAGQGPELGGLALPLGWVRLHNGPTHNPPTTIRQALDNTDGRLDAVLDEIEAARDSTIFGAKGTLDERIEAVDTHARVVVSVTDGVNSVGGMYNGVSALQDAITAFGVSGSGATLMVRKGSYTITSALVINTPLSIIAVEKDVIVSISGVSTPTYALTFAPTGLRNAKSIVSGLLFTGTGMYAVQATGSEWVFDRLMFQTARGMLINGVGIGVRHVHFSTESLCLAFGNAAAQCRVESCRFESADLTQPLLSYSSLVGGNSIVDCFLDVLDDQRGFTDSSSAIGLTIHNLRITCRPYSASKTVFSIAGAQITVEGLWFTMASAGDIRATLLSIASLLGPVVVRNVTLDLNENPLRYSAGNNPVSLYGENILVEGFWLTKPYLSASGYMSADEPIIALASVASGSVPVVLRQARVDMFTHAVSPSGDMDVVVIGGRGAWAADGPFILDTVVIDTTGKDYATGTSILMGNMTPMSTIQNCRVFGDGQFGGAIHTRGAHSVKILHNDLRHDTYTWLPIAVDAVNSTQKSDNALIDGNYIQQPTAALLTSVEIMGAVGALLDRVRFVNNIIDDGVTGGQSVYFSYCDKPIAIGNSVTNGITWGVGVTNQKPDGGTIGLVDLNVLA